MKIECLSFPNFCLILLPSVHGSSAQTLEQNGTELYEKPPVQMSVLLGCHQKSALDNFLQFLVSFRT